MRIVSIKIASACTLALLTLITGCETEPILFRGPYHVRFTEPTGFDKESFSQPIDIQVHLAGPALEEDLTVGYLIGGSAREGIDYVILDERKKVKIPAGEYFGNIRIQLINNANNILRSQDIVLTLISANQNNLEVGQGPSAIGKVFTFTIFDDCILGGTYTGERIGGIYEYDGISITSQDCETYLLSDWNLDLPNEYGNAVMDLNFIDNGDNTLTIPVQEEETLEDEEATIKGSGVVDPTTREIMIKVIFVDIENQPEFSFVYKPV
jgi:hypothetical protein